MATKSDNPNIAAASPQLARKPRAADKTDDVPRYRALVESFIDNRLIPADGEVSYYGVPGANLVPLNEAARVNKTAADAIRTDRKLDHTERADKLRALDDDLQDVTLPDDDFEFTGGRQVSEPISAAAE